MVLIADDDLELTKATKLILEMEGYSVVTAANGYEALQVLESNPITLIIADIAMPEMNGIEVARRIQQKHPDVRVLLLSVHSNEEYVSEALASGAAGYVLKDAGVTELDLAVRAVARGESYLSPSIAKQVVSGHVQPGGDVSSSLARLTDRQREILQLIAEGNSTKQIAKKLGVSVKTVETHRAQLMSRLDIHDIAGLVRYAMRVGLISP